MKTEARKAYEKQMPLSEIFLREEIQQQKHYLMLSKKMIENWNALKTGPFKGLTWRDADYINGRINNLLDDIKAHKRLIQILKNGLPQRRPKGVMAKCPFCGTKHWERIVIGPNTNRCIIHLLYADEDKHEGVVVAGCRKCGAHIKRWDTSEVQDVIDLWNRRK